MMTLAKKLITGSGKIALEAADPSTYVEFVSSTAMMITPKYTNSGVTLQYSLDGSIWTTIAAGATTPSANIIYFRGSATGTKSLYSAASYNNAWTFSGATNLECNGKLDRLLQDELGDDSDILTIGNSCFAYMFSNVTSLIKAPELPATTLASNCYQYMFDGCTSLITAPTLPATTLANYCYSSMFDGCTSLTIAPELPATTLANSCYNSMFQSCTNLTTMPILPATTLIAYCYSGMFKRCSKIRLSTSMIDIYDTAYRIPTVGTGIIASNALIGMFEYTGGAFKGTPTINTTYYTENTPV